MTVSSHLVVFDLDDTLYLERDYVMSGFKAVDSFLQISFGVVGFADRASDVFDSGERSKVFDRVLLELGVGEPETILETLVDVYRNHSPKIFLTENVREILTELKQHRRLAVLTDGFADAQRLKISALGVEHFVEEIVVTGERHPSWRKPGRPGFEYLQSRFGALPANSIYLGDNPQKDFEGPLSLGWTVARMRFEQGIYGHLPTPDGIPEFSTLEGFRDWIEGELSCPP